MFGTPNPPSVIISGTWEIVGVHDFDACATDGCTPDASLDQYGGDTSVYANVVFLDLYLAPEPGSWMLVSTGLLGLGTARRLVTSLKFGR